MTHVYTPHKGASKVGHYQNNCDSHVRHFKNNIHNIDWGVGHFKAYVSH